MVSDGVRLSEVGLGTFPKPRVARSIRVGGTNFQWFRHQLPSEGDAVSKYVHIVFIRRDLNQTLVPD